MSLYATRFWTSSAIWRCWVCRFWAKVVAERSGHIMHAGLMSKLLRVRSAWDIVDVPQLPVKSQVQVPMLPSLLSAT